MKKPKPPATKADGQARAVTMLRDLSKANWSRLALTKSEGIFDKAMREAMTWPRAARLGFAYVCADWLQTEANGMGYGLDGYEASLKRGRRGTDNG